MAPNLGGYTDAGMPSGAKDNGAEGGRRRVTKRLVFSCWIGGNEPPWPLEAKIWAVFLGHYLTAFNGDSAIQYSTHQ